MVRDRDIVTNFTDFVSDELCRYGFVNRLIISNKDTGWIVRLCSLKAQNKLQLFSDIYNHIDSAKVRSQVQFIVIYTFRKCLIIIPLVCMKNAMCCWFECHLY